MKTTPHGIGLAYCTAKGVTIVRHSVANGVLRWRDLHRNGERPNTYIAASDFPSLDQRLEFWRTFLPELTDVRQAAMLSAILTHRPQLLHPTRRSSSSFAVPASAGLPSIPT